MILLEEFFLGVLLDFNAAKVQLQVLFFFINFFGNYSRYFISNSYIRFLKVFFLGFLQKIFLGFFRNFLSDPSRNFSPKKILLRVFKDFFRVFLLYFLKIFLLSFFFCQKFLQIFHLGFLPKVIFRFLKEISGISSGLVLVLFFIFFLFSEVFSGMLPGICFPLFLHLFGFFQRSILIFE